MIKTVIYVKDMDCPCEENMIKMKLSKFKIISTSANISKREFTIIHNDDEAEILRTIDALSLNSSLISSEKLKNSDVYIQHTDEKSLLFYVLLINFIFFILELGFGLLSNSMGLVADSFDMLSDALVYMMAIFVVSRSALAQKRVALLAGILQILLAFIGFYEVVRRFFDDGYLVDYRLMIIISLFAFIANWLCLVILNKSKSDKPHIKASVIFTSNDIIINLGVIFAGVLVLFLNTNIPDLLIGAVVFVFVCNGAFKILSLYK